MPSRSLRIPPGAATRLDRALAEALAGEHSRTELARLITEGRVLLNGRPAKPRSAVEEGDEVVVDLPEPEPSDLAAEDLPIGIVFQDEHLAVIDKPAPMITHPAGPIRTGTLVNALLHHVKDLSGVGGVLRPGIVHRLDRGTTGLLVIAKSDEAHRRLADQLARRVLKRTYEAVAWGPVSPPQFTIDEPVARHPRDRKLMAVVPGGKEARTHVTVRLATDLASHLELDLETGRTHQIRVHLRHLDMPIVGDPDYGGRRRALRMAAPALRGRARDLIGEIDRPALHARRLRFDHPFTGEPVAFESPLPEDFLRVLRRVEAERPPHGKIR